MYKIHSSSVGWTYSRLEIPKRVSPIVNDLLVGDNAIPEQDITALDDEETTSYLKNDLYFYINLEMDREIPSEELCSKVNDF